MAQTPEAPAGEMELVFGPGDSVVLKCTLSACMAICRSPGGLYGPNGVSTRLSNCDIDTAAFLVRAGLGLTGRAVPEIEGKVFKGGLLYVCQQLSVFVGMVANGGKPLAGVAEDDEGGDAGGPANPPQDAA